MMLTFNCHCKDNNIVVVDVVFVILSIFSLFFFYFFSSVCCWLIIWCCCCNGKIRNKWSSSVLVSLKSVGKNNGFEFYAKKVEKKIRKKNSSKRRFGMCFAFSSQRRIRINAKNFILNEKGEYSLQT